MADNWNLGLPRKITDYEANLFDETWRVFAQLQLMRNTTASHWEEVAQLILPTSSNTFFYGSDMWPGMKKSFRQVDASGMLALHRFAAILDSLLTPRNMFWHALGVNDPYVMKDRDTKEWFNNATRTLFQYRYSPNSNFAAQNQNNYVSLGAFGTGGMFVDQLQGPYGPMPGLRYKHIPLGELYIQENHQGVPDGFIRWYRLTARQCMQAWGPDKFPAQLRPALEQNSEMKFNFLHRVCPRMDMEPGRLDAKGMPYASYYFCVEGKCLMQEGGYRSMPSAISRYEQTPNETYGRSPAMAVLPALKTLNAEKTTFLTVGHRAANPILLTADDGVVDMQMHPGAINKGGMSGDGKLLVGVLPTGEIQITEEMMKEEKTLINDAFLVTLFQILTETPQMTATEVIERTNEKGILLAPTVGRQQSEYLGVMVPRELSVLSQQRLIAPPPPRLMEAIRASRGGLELEVIYTSPISRAMRAQEAAGFMRAVETSKEIVNITQDPGYLDWADFDTALPEMAEIQGTPVRWTATDEQVKLKRKGRAQAQARQEQIQALPAQAAMLKAQATVQKNQPGVAGPQPATSGGGPQPGPSQ